MSGKQESGFTSVHYLILMAPVDSFDELVDVAANFIRRGTSGQFFQELQHVLQTTTNLESWRAAVSTCRFNVTWKCSVGCFPANSDSGDSSISLFFFKRNCQSAEGDMVIKK